jgi:Lipoprotein signal peptidase
MFKSKTTWLFVVLLILLDQGIKLYISGNFTVGQSIPLLPPVLYFFPIFNTNYTWVSSMMDISLSKWIYIAIVAFLLVIILLFYRYLQNRLSQNNTVNVLFAFLFSGALCSLLDKLFWNGSLDFIQLNHFFTFDTKDVYVSVFIGLVLLFIVQSNKVLKEIGSSSVLRGFVETLSKKKQ